MLQSTIYFLAWLSHLDEHYTDTAEQISALNVFFLLYDCGNFLYMLVRIYLASFEYTASFQYVCQQQQWQRQKPSIHVRLITLLFQRLVMIFKERSRCVLITSQTKIFPRSPLHWNPLHSWWFEPGARLPCYSEHSDVQHGDSSSQTEDPSSTQSVAGSKGVPRHYADVWWYGKGEESSLPALIMVELVCNKHLSLSVCVCVCHVSCFSQGSNAYMLSKIWH